MRRPRSSPKTCSLPQGRGQNPAGSEANGAERSQCSVAHEARRFAGSETRRHVAPAASATYLAAIPTMFLARSPTIASGRSASWPSLRMAKVTRAIYSERQLQQMMDDFWFNHFNVFAGQGRRPLTT